MRDLNGLNGPGAPAQPVQTTPAFDTNTDAYIANLQSQSTLALINESLTRSARDFDAFLERTVTIDWDEQRQRIYEHFGLVPKGADLGNVDEGGSFSGGQDQRGFGRSTRKGRGQTADDGRREAAMRQSAFGTSSFQRSVIGSPAQGLSDQASLFTDTAEKASATNVEGVDDRFLREREKRLAERVQALNAARMDDRFFPVFHEFAAAEAQSAGDQVLFASGSRPEHANGFLNGRRPHTW